MHAPPAGRGRHMVLPAWMTRGTVSSGSSVSPSIGTPGQQQSPAAAAASPFPVAASAAAAAAAAGAAAVATPAPVVPATSPAGLNGGPPAGISGGLNGGPPEGAPPPVTGGPLGKWMSSSSLSGRRDSREKERDPRRGVDPLDGETEKETAATTEGEAPAAGGETQRKASALACLPTGFEVRRGLQDFYSEDRQGTAATREEFVKNLIDFEYSVRVTKRLVAEENKDHSFCLDFEDIKGGKNQINLYECRNSKLARVYSFRGVPEDAELVYHDYQHDPEVLVG
ncbi:hypothetical protein Emed_006545 [Eimeria media]